MKIFLAILFGAGLAAAATFVVVSNRQESLARAERDQLQQSWEKEKNSLEADLAAARKKRERSEDIQTPVAAPEVMVKPGPKEILATLKKLRVVNGPNRGRSLRQVIHQLESLAEYGTTALPAISEFFAKNEDLDYSTEVRDDNADRTNRFNGRGGGGTGGLPGRGRISTDFSIPPSLRLGLVDVLREIGGPDSEKILAQVLGTTGRGVEVNYLARTLQEISPNKYREVALSAAKDLLTNPLAIDHPNRLDEQSKAYLYDVLAMYNDASFASSAQQLLVDDQGRIDQSALRYLATLKEQAIPAFIDAFRNTRISNQFDKVNLAAQVLNYAGKNNQANEFLNEMVTNTNIDARARSFALMRMGGGDLGPMSQEATKDPELIKARMQVLEAIKPGLTDERVLSALNFTQQNLQRTLNGEEPQNPFQQFRRDGGGPGAGFGPGGFGAGQGAPRQAGQDGGQGRRNRGARQGTAAPAPGNQ